MLALVLLASTAASATAAQPDEGKRVRCVREQVIGSLVQTRRVCHTEEEWRRIRRDANDEANRVFRDSQGRPSTNG